MIDSKPMDCPMNQNKKSMIVQGEAFFDLERYIRLVGKLVYLTITRSNLSFIVGVMSQLMQNFSINHW